jgi:hypothetical protein
MNKKLYIITAAIVVVGAISFYGGMKYGQSTTSKNNSGMPNFQNLTSDQRQQMLGGTNGTRRSATNAGSQFINGEIISKDDKSIIVKLRDGGSKIIFLSNTTSIGKTTDGVVGDLEVGEDVSVNGTANSDGSVVAQNIQIRPTVTDIKQ